MNDPKELIRVSAIEENHTNSIAVTNELIKDITDIMRQYLMTEKQVWLNDKELSVIAVKNCTSDKALMKMAAARVIAVYLVSNYLVQGDK